MLSRIGLERAGKLLGALLMLLSVSGPAYPQGGSLFSGGITVLSTTGRPIGGATVTICAFGATGMPCSPTITVYTSPALGPTAANPDVTDGNGNLFKYAAPGKYTYTVTGPGIIGTSYTATVAGSGGGDVLLSGGNAFTGLNTDSQLHAFNGGITTTTTNSTGAGTHSGAETFSKVNGVCIVDGVGNATLAAAVTCAGSSGVIEIPMFAVPTLTGSVTIPVGVTLRFDGPSGITTTGFTLTVNGPIVAPPVQIFFGTGTVTLGTAAASQANMAWWPGVDAFVQLNNAYASMPAQGGDVTVTPLTGGGCYSVATTLSLNTVGKVMRIHGTTPLSISGAQLLSGSCFMYTHLTATNAVVLDYSPTAGGGYIPTAVFENIAIVSSSTEGGATRCTTNLGCGSLADGIHFGGTNAGGHFADLKDIYVAGFNNDVNIADGGAGWGINFYQMSLAYASGAAINLATYHENIHWFGGTCVVSVKCVSDTTGGSLTMSAISVDSNTTGFSGSSFVTCIGCWFENLGAGNAGGTQPFQIVSATGGVYTLSGIITNDNSVGTLANYFSMSAGNLTFQGTINSATQVVTNVFNNTGGAAGRLEFSSSSAANLASICSTPSACIVEKRGFPGGNQTDIPILRMASDGLNTITGAANYVVCHMLSGVQQCSYNNDAFATIPKVNLAATWTAAQTNMPLVTPTLTGLTNGTGLQLLNTTTTCTTAASVGAICTTAAITLPVAYADTNYRVACTGLTPTNVPIVQTVAKSNTTFTITIAALTAAAATFTSYDCHVGHN